MVHNTTCSLLLRSRTCSRLWNSQCCPQYATTRTSCGGGVERSLITLKSLEQVPRPIECWGSLRGKLVWRRSCAWDLRKSARPAVKSLTTCAGEGVLPVLMYLPFAQNCTFSYKGYVHGQHSVPVSTDRPRNKKAHGEYWVGRM
jgi:hypothetical protein